jgi:hypothetical protein
MLKHLEKVQWSSCWWFHKQSLRSASSTNRIDRTSMYVVMEPSWKLLTSSPSKYSHYLHCHKFSIHTFRLCPPCFVIYLKYCNGWTMNTVKKKKGKNNLQEGANGRNLRRKERWHTVRLFGTNSLKEGAVWRIYTMQELNIETCSSNYATVDEVVFSPCRAKPWWVAHCVASPHLVCCQATAINTWMTQEWGRVTWPHQQWCNSWSIFPQVRSRVYRRDWS